VVGKKVVAKMKKIPAGGRRCLVRRRRLPNGWVQPVFKQDRSRGRELGAIGIDAASSAQSKRAGTGIKRGGTELDGGSTRDGGACRGFRGCWLSSKVGAVVKWLVYGQAGVSRGGWAANGELGVDELPWVRLATWDSRGTSSSSSVSWRSTEWAQGV
jgi:hypothetical protein